MFRHFFSARAPKTRANQRRVFFISRRWLHFFEAMAARWVRKPADWQETTNQGSGTAQTGISTRFYSHKRTKSIILRKLMKNAKIMFICKNFDRRWTALDSIFDSGALALEFCRLLSRSILYIILGFSWPWKTISFLLLVSRSRATKLYSDTRHHHAKDPLQQLENRWKCWLYSRLLSNLLSSWITLWAFLCWFSWPKFDQSLFCMSNL